MQIILKGKEGKDFPVVKNPEAFEDSIKSQIMQKFKLRPIDEIIIEFDYLQRVGRYVIR